MKTQYLSLESLAINLGLPKQYLRDLANKGHIPNLNVKGRLRFSEVEVRSALSVIARKNNPNKEPTNESRT